MAIKKLLVTNNEFGVYEGRVFFDYDEAIKFANNAALYHHQENEREYKETCERVDRILEYAKEQSEEEFEETKKWHSYPKKPQNFKVEVSYKVNEGCNAEKWINVYSISRNKARDLHKMGLLGLDTDFAY